MSEFLPSTRFCAECFFPAKQLKPFRLYEDAAIKRLLESAWTKLGGKNKHYFVKEAEELAKAGKLTRSAAVPNTVEVGENDAFKIYRTEMRLILLQDTVFVRDHFHELEAVIKEGYNELNVTQRLYLNERAILAKLDGYTEKISKQQQPASVYGKTFRHDNIFLTNLIDQHAFDKYANHAQSKDPSLDANTLWTKWMHELTHHEREFYYQKKLQKYVSYDAEAAFIKEKSKEKPRTALYSMECVKLRNTWNDLSDLAQLIYISKSYEKLLKDEQNPLIRFKKNLAAKFYRTTTVDDITSSLKPIEPYYEFQHSCDGSINMDRFALLVYIEKMRPELLKKPGMVQKRYWEISYILRDQWNALSKEQQQPYYDSVYRYLEIREHLREWKVEKGHVAGWSFDTYNMDAKTTKREFQIALQNRKVLLKKYPDLLEYFAWVTYADPAKNSHVCVTSKSSSDTKKVDTGAQDVENDTKKSDDFTNTDYYYMMIKDSTDTAAFWQYRRAVETMTTEYVKPCVWWNQFVNLTDEERNVYYDAAFEKQVLRKARSLFAEDNCPIIPQSEDDDEYAKKMPHLREIWEGLSDPAKQYYKDLAEPEVLKRQKEIKENGYVKSKYESRYDADKKPSEFDDIGHLSFKKGYGTLGRTDYTTAFNIYLEKQHQQLWKEPGMVDKRYFQVALILEQRFKDLSDEERQPYLDMADRVKEIENYFLKLSVDWRFIYTKKDNYSYKYENASEEEEASCKEEAKQNFVYHNSETVKSPTSQPTKINKAGDPTLEIIDDNDVQEDTETTSAIDAESIVNDNTSEESESVDTCELVKGENVAVENNTVTEKNVEKGNTSSLESRPQDDSATTPDATMNPKILAVVKAAAEYKRQVLGTQSKLDNCAMQLAALKEELSILRKLVKDITLKSTSAELQKPLLNDTTVEESESAATCEFVDDEKNAEDELSKPTDTEAVEPAVFENAPESSANSVQAKKTPTAFMFYKKAMRRLNADQNFGKKDNDSQRQALISDWKKLSDEDKAVYFEKERLARLQLEKEQS
uniref:HMG box domain-containing protein n=1 Tax=Panagrellus redivivus TaxID=6233 RepID=A0A7E4W3R5_PANRE